jgi:microcystin-dependent protein
MATALSYTYTLTNGQPNDATQVMADFTNVSTWVNTNAVHLDGSKPMTGELSGTGSDPVSANQYARKQYVDRSIPFGSIQMFGGSAAPNANWLLCDGASLLRASYPDLFTAIGTTWGAADGTHFNVPDMRGRAPIGVGTGVSLTARTLAGQVGEENHVLTTAEMPVHTHVHVAHTHTASNSSTLDSQMETGGVFVRKNDIVPLLTLGNGGALNVDWVSETGNAAAHTHTPTINPFTSTENSQGGGTTHNNMQPSVGINFIIKAL